MITIKHDLKGNRGTFTAYEDNTEAGIMTYEQTDAHTILIDHTETYEGFEGRGIGKALVNAGKQYAETAGLTIVPVCSFARAVIKRSEQ